MKTNLKILSLLSFILLSTYSHIYSQTSNNSFSLNNYELVNDTTITEIFNDLSGVTYNPLTNTLFMVTNGNSRIYETNLRGQIIRSADLLYYSYGGNRRHDPEDIVHISGNRYAIAEERLGRIVYIRIDELGDDINLRDSTYVQLPGTWNSSDGVEGVSYDPNADEMYCVVENELELHRFDRSASNLSSTLECIFSGLGDVAAVHHLGLTAGLRGLNVENRLLALSDNSNLLIEADLNCTEYSRLDVPGTKVEGVTMDNNGNIYVVGEPNEFYVYSNPNLNLCRYNDSLALVDFYNALNPTSSNFWDLSQPMDTWAGVTLNENGCVTVLSLDERGIRGTISPSLSNLSQLTILDLSENLFSGTIPSELGELSNLKDLALDSNQLTGNIPPELGDLTNLNYLRLDNNQLGGCYPDELNVLCNQLHYTIGNEDISNGNNFDADWGNFCINGNCSFISCRQRDSLALADFYNMLEPTNLWDLNQPMTTWYGVTLNENGCVSEIYLEEAGLQGNISTKLGNLSELVRLDLNGNKLSGSIPAELGNLSNLNYLRLNSNQLTGNIPVELGNLSNLNYLILNSNQLTGNIPIELTNLSNLLYLRLSSNQLTGNIPPELGNLNNLSYLNLIANQLTGSIPAELGNLNNLSYLSLGYNQLTGCYPSTLNRFCGQIQYNHHISDGNNLDANWENFCNNGSGLCESVWPGDFNYDGSANTMDVLIWGLAKGNSSPIRPDATTDWIGQDCTASQQNVNGTNSMHQDGDGNGIINEQDLNVLMNNYGEVHLNSSAKSIGFGSMDYRIELLSETTIGGSTTLTYGLSITNGGNPVNLHGLEYAVSVSGLNNYSIEIDATDSSLEPQQTFTRGTNTVNVALTRTDRSNRLCDDVITKIVVVTQDVPEFQLTVHDGHTIQADGTTYTTSPSTINQAGANREDISEKGGYLMQNHPNPFTDNTTIQYHISEDITNAAIQVLDLTGRVVYEISIDQTGEGEIQINTEALPSGVYNYLLITNKGVSNAKKMIILK